MSSLMATVSNPIVKLGDSCRACCCLENTMTAELPGRRPATPLIVGTGFIALDVLITHESPDQLFFSAGGTCGNILAILGYLGWSSVALSRLSKDFAGEWVFGDLRRWGVN